MPIRLRFAAVCLKAIRSSLTARFCSCLAAPLAVLFVLAPLTCAQNAPGPNSDPTYQQLRSLTLGTEAVSLNNFDLKRDAGTFHFRSGTMCFVAPVQGKVTGAVFVGDGNFILQAPSAEMSMLKLLTKENEFSENFSRLVLRFTDSTYDDLKSGGSAASASCDTGLLKDSQHSTRHRLKQNLEARILEDLLSSKPGGLFVAFIHGKRYNDNERFQIEPRDGHDQVEFMTYDDNKFGVWASFPASDARANVPLGRSVRIEHQLLNTTLEKNASLQGKATTSFQSLMDGVRVVPFDLFRTLRVQSVTLEGQPLSFIQEDKNDDADFAVILPKALAAGEKDSIVTTYGGKEAVINEGSGNYFPVSRHDWFPNNRGSSLGEYASYDMTFRIPKGMRMVATGERVGDSNEGGQNVTVWKSEVPQTVAGFSFGKFKEEHTKLLKPEYLVQSFANEESPSWVQSLQHAASPDLAKPGQNTEPEVALGCMSTVVLNKKALAEGELAVQVYTDYFGPSLFKHLQITQQSACNFGQSWPEHCISGSRETSRQQLD